MGRPSKGQRARVSLLVDAATLAGVDAYGARRGLDRNAAACELLSMALVDDATTERPTPLHATKGGDLAAPDSSPPRRRFLVGYHPTTGEPLYREA